MTRLIIIGEILVVWLLMYQAGFHVYDDNLNILLLAFVLALGVCIALGIYGWRRRKEWRKGILDFLMLSIAGSPITVLWVAGHYKAVFGIALQF